MSGTEPTDQEASRATATAPARRYEQLIAWLAGHVRAHDLDVGDRLPPERTMAAQARISRASVRQGLTALQAKGVVEVRHGDGAYLVRPIRDAESVETLLAQRHRLPEVMEARSALEIELARLAAIRRTPTDMEGIDDALRHMAAEIGAGAHGLDGDARFHQAVTDAAHNRVMGELMAHIAWSIAEVRRSSLHAQDRRIASLNQHRAIAEAIRARDPEGAMRAARTHLAHVAAAQPGGSSAHLTP